MFRKDLISLNPPAANTVSIKTFLTYSVDITDNLRIFTCWFEVDFFDFDKVSDNLIRTCSSGCYKLSLPVACREKNETILMSIRFSKFQECLLVQ